MHFWEQGQQAQTGVLRKALVPEKQTKIQIKRGQIWNSGQRATPLLPPGDLPPGYHSSCAKDWHCSRPATPSCPDVSLQHGATAPNITRAPLVLTDRAQAPQRPGALSSLADSQPRGSAEIPDAWFHMGNLGLKGFELAAVICPAHSSELVFESWGFSFISKSGLRLCQDILRLTKFSQ